MTQISRGGMRLYPQQADVVDHALSNTCTVVSAGAGSGKTHTMLATVLELVERRMVGLDSVALITFTNAAADELADRLQCELHTRSQGGDEYWLRQLELSSLAFVGTIHRFCHRLLTRYAYSGVPARTDKVATRIAHLNTALDEVIEPLLRDGGPLTEFEIPEYELREKLRSALNALRGTGLDLSQILISTQGQPDDPGKKYRVAFAASLARIAEAFDAEKARAGVLDTNDLLHCTAVVLEGSEGGEIADDAAQRWKVLLVDEFQDTDRTQKRIIDCLASWLQVLVVVGDPKQSIYRFRGANVSLLEELADEQMGRAPLRLPISRRPTHVLLDAQNALFKGLADRYPELQEQTDKDVDASQSVAPLSPFVYLRIPRADEVLAIAEHIRVLLGLELPAENRLINGGDIAILVRSNTQVGRYVAELSAELRDTGVSVVAEAGESFFRRPAVVATFRVLVALLDYPNDALLSAALATPYFPGVDPTQPETRSLQYGVREGSPLTDWFEAMYPDLQASLKTMRDAVRTDTAPQFLSRLYDCLRIKDHFLAAGDLGALDDLERLREEARRLFRNEDALTVRIFVDRLRIQIRQNSPVAADDMYSPATTSIRVMTIHRAKGREFPVVVIPGMFRPLYSEEKTPWYVVGDEYGLDLDLPTSAGVRTSSAQWAGSIAEHRSAELREEMRLLYVAVTRAVHQVVFAGDPQRSNGPTSPYYSWADEVLRVYSRIPGALAIP